MGQSSQDQTAPDSCCSFLIFTFHVHGSVANLSNCQETSDFKISVLMEIHESVDKILP